MTCSRRFPTSRRRQSTDDSLRGSLVGGAGGSDAIDALAMDGATTFLVPVLPDLGLTPELNTTPLAPLERSSQPATTRTCWRISRRWRLSTA